MKLVKRDMKNSQERLLNYFKKKENKEFHFLFSLVLVLITIPLPKYSLSSQALILLISSWIFLNPISKKITILKKNTIKFYDSCLIKALQVYLVLDYHNVQQKKVV